MTIENLQAKAAAGSVVANGLLGFAYLFGEEGASKDYALALQYLSDAAARGAPRPSVWLGTMYEGGLGVPVELEKARDLYQFDADRGELFGCVFLARLLASGRLGAVDGAGATHWYKAALGLANVDECDELVEARNYLSDNTAG